MPKNFYELLVEMVSNGRKALAVLIDPEKFNLDSTASFLMKLPANTTHLFVGGSTVPEGEVESLILKLKEHTKLPIFIFPGSFNQLCEHADAVLFLSLVSGRNPEYIIGQQILAAPILSKLNLEVISTGYLLIDGGNVSAVERVTETKPISQDAILEIVNTTKASELLGAKLIYLEAGSGAKYRVKDEIISAVKREISVPLIVGGGIRTTEEMNFVFDAGADIVVMGTAFEN